MCPATLLPTVPLLALLAVHVPCQAPVVREVAAMGTWLQVAVEATDRNRALAASEAAVRAVEAVEARLSTWRADSEIARANANPVGQEMRVSDEMRTDLNFAFGLVQPAAGAFDPAIGAVLDAYGMRGVRAWPTARGLADALAASGRHAIAWNGERLVRRSTAAWVATDAFAKGIALDRAGTAARAAGAQAVAFDFGGQWLVHGRTLAVAIAHPRERASCVAMLHLGSDSSAATSGNGEQALEVAGRTMGHLFDPRTGEPAADFGSVTALAPTAALADAASTALFVLGIEQGLARARQLGVEALFVELVPSAAPTPAPAQVRLHATPGLRRRLTGDGPAAPAEIPSFDYPPSASQQEPASGQPRRGGPAPGIWP